VWVTRNHKLGINTVTFYDYAAYQPTGSAADGQNECSWKQCLVDIPTMASWNVVLDNPLVAGG